MRYQPLRENTSDPFQPTVVSGISYYTATVMCTKVHRWWR